MNYKLTKKNDKTWIHEKETEFEFGPYEDREEARTKMRFMNMGGAFDGFTPNFMKNAPLKPLDNTSGS